MMRVYPQRKTVMKLVLLPGLDGTGELFAPFLDAMQGVDAQVISYPPDREMTYLEHEEYVRERLPRDGPFVLLGESFSGPIAISITACAPTNLRGLILCCSFAANPLPVFGSLSRLVAAFPAMRIPPRLFAPFLYGGHATPALRTAHSQAMSRVATRTLRARVAACWPSTPGDDVEAGGFDVQRVLRRHDLEIGLIDREQRRNRRRQQRQAASAAADAWRMRAPTNGWSAQWSEPVMSRAWLLLYSFSDLAGWT
jgi:hypothetical protein